MSGILLPALLAGAAVAVLLVRPAPRRLRDVLPATRAAERPGRRPSAARSACGGRPASAAHPDAASLACGAGAVGAAVAVPAPVGLVVALALVAVGPRLLRRLEPAAVRRARAELARDAPLVLDLLAACLTGGASPSAALGAVAEAVGGPGADRLRAVGAAVDVGLPPAHAWAALAGDRPDDPLRPAARALARAAEGGAPVAAAVTALAAEARADARAAGQEAARRAGVLAVAPLGLCFLPSFVLLGVVPVVVGLAAPVLGAP